MKFPTLQRPRLHFSVLAANLLSFTSGLHMTWSSPVLPKLSASDRLEENPLGRIITSEEAMLIGSILNLGAIITPFLSGYSSAKFGRKNTIALTCIPFIASSIILALSPNIESIYAGRILAGLSLGATFTIIPTYSSEIGENSIRGLLGVMMNLFVASGILLAYVIGPYLSVMWFSAICGVFPLACLVSSWETSESPYFFIEKLDRDGAVKVLKELRPKAYPLDSEICDVAQFVESGKNGRISDLIYSKSARKALVISCMLMIFQQWSGLNSITMYAESLFQESGSDLKPEVSSMVFGTTQLIFTCFTPFLVDRLGRKPLLFVSAFGMLVSEVSLAVYYKLKEDSFDVKPLSWMPVAFLLTFIASQNLGYIILPFVIAAEIFPNSIRVAAVNISISFSWLMSFLATLTYIPIVDVMNYSGLFILYSAFNLVAMFFGIFYVPETMNKSFQEIQDSL